MALGAVRARRTAGRDFRRARSTEVRATSTVDLPLLGIRAGDELRNEWVTRFSPIHSVYTLSWRDPKTDERRPYALRVILFFVPVTERTTRLVSFTYSRATGRLVIPRKILDALSYAMGWVEVWDDVRWVRNLADTQRGFEGMRLTRFDKPLAHNRKLADALYYGTPVILLRKPNS